METCTTPPDAGTEIMTTDSKKAILKTSEKSKEAITRMKAEAVTPLDKVVAEEAESIINETIEQAKSNEVFPKPRKNESMKWKDVNEPIKFVCQGAKVLCMFCSYPIGNIRVTSTEVKLQDTFWATGGDRNGAPMPNLVFNGICMHPKWGLNKPPCMGVIQLGMWKNVSETHIDNYNALLRKSAIPCIHSTLDILILHSGQIAMPEDLYPEGIKQPKIKDQYWGDELNDPTDYIAGDSRVNIIVKTEGLDYSEDTIVTIGHYWDNPETKTREFLSDDRIETTMMSPVFCHNYMCVHPEALTKRILFLKFKVEVPAHNLTAESDFVEVVTRVGSIMLIGIGDDLINELTTKALQWAKEKIDSESEMDKNAEPEIQKEFADAKIINEKGVEFGSRSDVYNMIRLGLHPDESTYLKIFSYLGITHIDLYELKKAQKEGKNISTNYDNLLEICMHKEYTEVYLCSAYITLNNNKNISCKQYSNDLRDLIKDEWDIYNGAADFSGYINHIEAGKNITYKKLEQFLWENYGSSHDLVVNGITAVTLYPTTYKERLQYSTTKHNQISVNIYQINKERTRFFAHEAYGHLLYKLQGKNHSHGSSRMPGNPGYNEPLETQIDAREKEAVTNFDLYNL